MKCQNCKIEFNIEPQDFEFYKKVEVPAPTFCPDCRMQRRMAFRNDVNLRKRKDDLTGKEIFSMFNPEDPVKVYDRKVWFSDKCDPMDYGMEYDFKKPFFEQIRELQSQVPFPSRAIQKSVNSDYCANGGYLKNCYLCFGVGFSENCSYLYRTHHAKDSYDSAYLSKCELCYESFMLAGCYKAFFSSNCADSQEIYFCNNCVNCQNCFGCTNLKHKKYHIFNKSYAKQEYFKKLKEFNLGSYKDAQELKQKTKELHLKFPNKFMLGRHNFNVTGDDIYNSKNVFDSYTIKDGENLRYCQFLETAPGTKDSYDFTTPGFNAKLIYECITVGDGINNVRFSYNCFPNCQDMELCINCHSSSNLFGCIGLTHKQYCIFNKQYTKEEYHELVSKIKKHMDQMPYTDKKGNIYKYGEFFPTEIAPFSYNETLAYQYFPLTKEQTLNQGLRWYNKPQSEYKATIKAKDLLDDIKDVDESILKEAIECGNEAKGDCNSSGVFRITESEFKFYKKHNLSLPRLCPDCRRRKRVEQRNPMKLWERQCMKKGCDVKFQTSYAPDRKEIIYCEKCYQKEIE